MDWLNLSALADLGSPAIVALFVVAILMGKLRPQSAVQEIREDRDARLVEAHARVAQVLEMYNLMESAYKTSEAARMSQAEVLKDIMNTMKTVQAPMSRLVGGDHEEEA